MVKCAGNPVLYHIDRSAALGDVIGCWNLTYQFHFKYIRFWIPSSRVPFPP